MRFRHAVPAAAVATGLVLLTGGPALAAYPPTIGTGRVSKSVVRPGKVVAFCGTGYAGKSIVVIKVDGRFYSTVRTGGGGRFCAAVRMSGIGNHTLSSWGTGAGHRERILVALVTVRAKHKGGGHGSSTPAAAPAMSPVANSQHPSTGSRLTAAELAALVSAGLILTGAATGYRVAARRRE